jgi:hypothetical protein
MSWERSPPVAAAAAAAAGKKRIYNQLLRSENCQEFHPQFEPSPPVCNENIFRLEK